MSQTLLRINQHKQAAIKEVEIATVEGKELKKLASLFHKEQEILKVYIQNIYNEITWYNKKGKTFNIKLT